MDWVRLGIKRFLLAQMLLGLLVFPVFLKQVRLDPTLTTAAVLLLGIVEGGLLTIALIWAYVSK